MKKTLHGPVLRTAILGILCWVVSTAGLAQAANDELIQACEAAASLLKEEDIDGALEEAGWCFEGIQQLKKEQTVAIFPDSLEGYTGSELTTQSVMGMKMIERYYTKVGESISVSLMRGGPATAGLAALAQLGLNIGEGGKKMRIQRRTVVDMSDGSTVELMVKLKSGGILTIKSDDASRDSVVAFTQAFPIKELDDALDDR